MLRGKLPTGALLEKHGLQVPYWKPYWICRHLIENQIWFAPLLLKSPLILQDFLPLVRAMKQGNVKLLNETLLAQQVGLARVQRWKSWRTVTLGISGGRSLSGPLRDARRFPSTRWYLVPGATRTSLGFGICPSFKGHFLSRRAKP
jgi:hypothetical protein